MINEKNCVKGKGRIAKLGVLPGKEGAQLGGGIKLKQRELFPCSSSDGGSGELRMRVQEKCRIFDLSNWCQRNRCSIKNSIFYVALILSLGV